MARFPVYRAVLGVLVLVPMLAIASCSEAHEALAPTPDADAAADTSTPTSREPDVDAGGPDATPDAPDVEGDLERDYCTPSMALVCSRAQTCGCGTLLPGGALDVAACTKRLSETCMAAWGALVAAGAKIDEAAAAACVAKLDQATPACGEPSGAVVFAACAPFAIDPADIGEDCKTPYCAGGSGRCVKGKCTAAGGAGTECQDEYRCASGFVCSPVKGTCVPQGTAGTTCDVTQECAPPLACLGGSCKALGAAGAPCKDASECGVGLVCTADRCAAPPTACAHASDCGQGASCGGPRTCVARLGAGGACAEDRDCEPSLFCDDVGRTCTTRPAQGEPCAKGTICAAGLGCNAESGTCLPLPGDGEPCAAGEPFCADNLGCNDFVCGPLPAEGAPCTVDYRCADGLACDFARDGSTCIAPRAAGEPCASDRSCAAGLHCGAAGTCEPKRPAGAACTSSAECTGICAPDESGGLSCRAAPAMGDPCLVGDDCPVTLRCAAQTKTCIAQVCSAL